MARYALKDQLFVGLIQTRWQTARPVQADQATHRCTQEQHPYRPLEHGIRPGQPGVCREQDNGQRAGVGVKL